jgi:DNA-binding transcriptional regulator GbsR (MarR family)
VYKILAHCGYLTQSEIVKKTMLSSGAVQFALSKLYDEHLIDTRFAKVAGQNLYGLCWQGVI